MYIDCTPTLNKLLSIGRSHADTVEKMINRKPKLTVIVVGDDPASAVYVRNKTKVCAGAGVDSETIALPATAKFEDVRGLILKLNADDSVDGVLLQLPLPTALARFTDDLIQTIDPGKDVDGLTYANIGKHWGGDESGLRPCTPSGVLTFIRDQVGVGEDAALDGKLVVIVNRSNLVGRPLAANVLALNGTPVIAHSRTANLAELTRMADVVVVAVGKPGFITPDMVKPGALVVDVGINRVDGAVVGDVAPATAAVADVTPVPGGVGRFTTASLALNVQRAAVDRHGR